MTLSQLNYVVAVDTHRNFVEAAKNCYITQPTLSMQIKKLEEELEVVIFDRTRQPVVPTQIGEIIIRQARIILRESARLEEQIQAARGQVRGEYRLGIIPTLSDTVLPLFLKPFTSRYPDVRLVIQELQTEVMVERLERDELDGGIAATPIENAELMERPLFYEPFYLYLTENHPLAQSDMVRETDLVGQDVWLLSEGHCFRNQVVQLCGLQQKPTESNPVRFESGNLKTLIRLVEQQYGMTLLPHLLVREFEAEKQKNMVRPFEHPMPMREVSLIHHRQYVKEAISQALFDEIIAELPPELKTSTSADGQIVKPF